eukprot:TRINITY_DN29047_c3_g1_i1.p1 TRINITY_DN29047_c3_g1~~TRINITY_DN29047_c3_g1_i1.p1  ORF type:complete len:268 (+),score=44.41 TRINITY_DN29047_c3_g1_i1:142-945(+)
MSSAHHRLRRAPEALRLRLQKPLPRWNAPASTLKGFEKELPLTGPFASTELFRQLERLRPPKHLVLEAVGSHAVLRAFKALANSGPLREPARFVAVEFEAPPPPPTPGQARLSRSLSGRAIRGIRFFVAPASAAPGAVPPERPLDTLQVAGKTDVMALAKAISVERKMRDRVTPVTVETMCTRRHALVLCKALAKAQQLAFMTGDPERLISCTAYVTKLKSPELQSGGRDEEHELRNTNGSVDVPRLLRVFIWTPDCTDEVFEHDRL